MMNQLHRPSTQSFSNLIVSFLQAPIWYCACSNFWSTTVHKDDISREQLKELLYDEIMSFRPAPIT